MYGHADEGERDEQIAARVQKGDAEAFHLIVVRYERKLARYAKRFLFGFDDAKDLVQDVFMKAYVNIGSFDTERRFSPWLYRIAHNEFVNALRKKTEKKKMEAEPIIIMTEDGPEAVLPELVASETADGSMRREEVRELFYHALGKLDPRYRDPLVRY